MMKRLPRAQTALMLVTLAALSCNDGSPAGGGPASSAQTTALAPPMSPATVSPSGSAVPSSSAVASALYQLPELPGFTKLKTPPVNPLSEAKVALGKLLFFDKRLGSNAACVDCHKPDRAWGDGLALSTRASGIRNRRHTPTLMNVGYQKYWGWDGRSPTLEAHIDEEWTAQLSATPEVAASRIQKDNGYAQEFVAAFGDAAATRQRIVHALASFVRTLRSGNAPYDKFEQGDGKAVSEAAARGFLVFRDKAGCTACHVPPMYTDFRFHNLGVGFAKAKAGTPGAKATDVDPGRGDVTKKKWDHGRFKTPTLRSAASTAPYFHDGSAATLEAAVDFVLAGGRANEHRDLGLVRVQLTSLQRSDLLAFIRSLGAP